jgi:uncharacterized protein
VYFASYSLATDDAGVAQRLAVRTTRAHREQYLTLTRSEEDLWLLDYQLAQGARTLRTHFGGALDVDLAFSPLFPALPIRRLGLHRDPAQHGLTAVFISLPALEVGCSSRPTAPFRWASPPWSASPTRYSPPISSSTPTAW